MEEKEWYKEQLEKEIANTSIYILALKQAVQTETRPTIIDICKRIADSADNYNYYYNKVKENILNSEDDNGAQQ